MAPGTTPGRENPGIVAAADHDPDAALGAAREFVVEHVRLEQRVAHGEKEKIDVEQIEKPGDGLSRVQPGADSLDRAGVAQLRERAPAAGDQLSKVSVQPGGILVIPAVQVVDEQKVDRIDSQSLQTVLERTH